MKDIFGKRDNISRIGFWYLLLQESIEEEVKDIAEAFTASARASASFVDSDLVDLDDDDDNKDIILEDKPDESVKLVSVSKLGSKESISDKDRLKAGIMTTNKKVWGFRMNLDIKLFILGPDPLSEGWLVRMRSSPQRFGEVWRSWTWTYSFEGCMWPSHWQHSLDVCCHGEQAHHHWANDQPWLRPLGRQQGEVLCAAPGIYVWQGGYSQVPPELQGWPKSTWRPSSHKFCSSCCLQAYLYSNFETFSEYYVVCFIF